MIYIASPYTSETRDLESQRASAVARYASHLIRAGYPAFSPIAHGHYIDQCVVKGTEPKYDHWIKHGLALMRGAVELHVFMLDGWQESSGVQREISLADHLNLPIDYISAIGYRRHDQLMSVV